MDIPFCKASLQSGSPLSPNKRPGAGARFPNSLFDKASLLRTAGGYGRGRCRLPGRVISTPSIHSVSDRGRSKVGGEGRPGRTMSTSVSPMRTDSVSRARASGRTRRVSFCEGVWKGLG